jgi:tRNA U34 5-methylaminomethyl-2-thiouridine-forming methyltransferase MnmC
MSLLEFIVTSDGSHTLRNTDLNETYHSIHGARQESLHVFIANGLAHFVAQHNPVSVSLLEVGFGTGLNAFLAWEFALAKDISINYDTIEPFPLRDEVWSRLNYVDHGETKASFSALHKAEWKEVALDAHFRLNKIQNTLWNATLHRSYDVIFFDAFAPSVQPELWTLESLEKVVNLMSDGGVFVTYSARGQLKRDLKTLGLNVEVLPGPPGKNEMVRGTARKK